MVKSLIAFLKDRIKLQLFYYFWVILSSLSKSLKNYFFMSFYILEEIFLSILMVELYFHQSKLPNRQNETLYSSLMTFLIITDATLSTSFPPSLIACIFHFLATLSTWFFAFWFDPEDILFNFLIPVLSVTFSAYAKSYLFSQANFCSVSFA